MTQEEVRPVGTPDYRRIVQNQHMKSVAMLLFAVSGFVVGIALLLLVIKDREDDRIRECKSEVTGRVNIHSAVIGVAHARGALGAYQGRPDSFIAEQVEIVEETDIKLQEALEDLRNLGDVC